MKKKIEHPKVFISYAWGTKEHDGKVLAFASKLVEDGIEVILDKWDMTEGNDTYSFMERSVNDSTITNVLMLLDPLYAQKADSHKGGVGTETQIISAQVYQEVNQDKFIPIIFERGENGEVCKPTYLQGRLHFDLTNAETYDEEYQRLGRTLYGEETYVKPKLGKRPSWVDKSISYSPKVMVRYDEIKQNTNNIAKGQLFRSFLKQLSDRIIAFSKDKKEIKDSEDCIKQYDQTQDIRNEYLLLLQYSIYVDDYVEDIATFFEDTANNSADSNSIYGQFAKIALHELFIYTIACLWTNKEYKELGYIFGRTYFTNSYRGDDGATSYEMFHSGSSQDLLDQAVNQVDGQKYYSGVASHWIANIASDFISKELFVFADLLCYNYSIYGKTYLCDWWWFPVTYKCDNRYDSLFSKFGKKLLSRKSVETFLPIFQFDSLDEFKKNYKEKHSVNEFNQYRFRETLESAKVLGLITLPDKVGVLP